MKEMLVHGQPLLKKNEKTATPLLFMGVLVEKSCKIFNMIVTLTSEVKEM